MRRVRRGLVVAMAMGLLGSVGCFLFGKPKPQTITTTETTTHKPPTTSQQGRRFEIITRLIELPAGNDYLNRTIWVSTHDPLPHQHSAILAANGLRLGLMADPAPPEFDRYARSETHSLDARLRTTSAGTAKVIPLNAPHETLTIDVLRQLSEAPAELTLTGAECAYTLTITEDPDGRVLVKAAPQIQHGEKRRWWNSNEQGTGMQVEDKRPTEEFPNLAWTLPLNSNDVLILGPTEQPSRTLGEACFYTPDGKHQRVLVLQVRAIAQTDVTPPNTPGPVANLVR
jgi:hypothetical protein